MSTGGNRKLFSAATKVPAINAPPPFGTYLMTPVKKSSSLASVQTYLPLKFFAEKLDRKAPAFGTETPSSKPTPPRAATSFEMRCFLVDMNFLILLRFAGTGISKRHEYL